MDFRLLVVGLLVNLTAPLIYGLLWNWALGQNSISLLDFSNVTLIAVLAFGLLLVGYGLVRRGVVKDWQAGILFVGSFALGIFMFLFYFWIGIGYSDAQAACGGFPQGNIWNSQDVILTRCDIFYRVQSYPALQWVAIIPLAATVLSFLGSFVAARRISLAR